MKKALLLLIFGFSILFTLPVHAETSIRAEVGEVLFKRGFLMNHPETNEKFLITVGTGCGEFEDGQSINLIINGTLNYNGDWVKTDDIHKCRIQQAQPYTQKLYVQFVFTGNTEAWVIADDGKEYFMKYSYGCASMPSHRRQNIYTEQGKAAELAQGDKIYLPLQRGNCYVTFLREKRAHKARKPVASGKDESVPTRVSHVRALPGNGTMFLNWRKATDNVGVDHYIVSYNNAPIDTEDVSASGMPNQTETENNHFRIRGLDNNEVYFFYILAVDAVGNVSSNWSEEISGSPRASVLSADIQSSGEQFINLDLVNESSRSLLFKWSPPSGTVRQTVILEADGEREFAFTGYYQHHIRILKREHRRGKTLKLIIRAYSVVSLIAENEIVFEFE